MLFLPGWLISALTFPGIIVHEWAHKKFCDWTGVSVSKVVYFKFGNPAGYVLHEEPSTYKQTFWISVGPLIINSVLTILIGIFLTQADSGSGMYFLLFWLGLSIGMHSFPSDHDMTHISAKSKEALKSDGSALHYLSYPFTWMIWIANKLRIFWFDAIYAFILLFLFAGAQ